MGLERTPLAGNNKWVVTCTINGQERQIILTQDERQRYMTMPQEQQQTYLETLHASHQQEIEQETLIKQTVTPTPQFTSTPSERKDLPIYEGGVRSSFTRPTTPGAKSPVSLDNSEDQEIDNIKNRTAKIEEEMMIQKDRQKLYENVENWDYTEEEETQENERKACKDRLDEFKRLTQSILSAPARNFYKAYKEFLYQFDPERSDDIPKQFGDDLLKELQETYAKMEEAREECLKVLTRQDREANPKFDEYLNDKFDIVCQCRRAHQKYFEKQRNKKEILRQQQLDLEQDMQRKQQKQPTKPSARSKSLDNQRVGNQAGFNRNQDTNYGQSQERSRFDQYDYQDPNYGQSGFYHHGHQDPTYGQYQPRQRFQHDHQNPNYGQSQGRPEFEHYDYQDPNYGQSQQRSGFHYHGHQDPRSGQYQQRQRFHHNHQSPNHGQSQERPEFAHYDSQDPNYSQSQQRHRFNHRGAQQPPPFTIYNDPSHIPTPSGPSEIIEQHHPIKFRIKDELEVIEPFDGSKPQDYLRFRVQWKNLDNKMAHIRDISELDKFYYLRKVLRGSAKQNIDTKHVSEFSYRRSINILEGLYYKPRLHATETIYSLSKDDKMVDTYDSLMKGYNRLKDCWDDLEHMNLTNSELKGLLLIVSNEKNLSKDTMSLWHQIQNDTRYSENSMECLDGNIFLGTIHTAMNNAQREQSVVGRRPPSRPSRPRPTSTLYGSYNTSITSSPKESTRQAGTGCVFCQSGNRHRYQLYCPKLKDMNPEKIWQIMKQNGITCQMCLCLGHNTRGCPAIKNGALKLCNLKDAQNEICGKSHCRFLHQEPKKELAQNELTDVPEELASTDQQ